jgi:hypothetical protein
MYGEAPDTLSVSIVTVPEDALGLVGKLVLTDGIIYVN